MDGDTCNEDQHFISVHSVSSDAFQMEKKALDAIIMYMNCVWKESERMHADQSYQCVQ